MSMKRILGARQMKSQPYLPQSATILTAKKKFPIYHFLKTNKKNPVPTATKTAEKTTPQH